MGLFSRITKIFEAKANDAVDQAEDPAQMQAQAVRDLKEKLSNAIKAQVQLKTLVVSKRSKATNAEAEAKTWEDKAIRLLDQVGNGLTQEEADKLATEALAKQAELLAQAKQYNGEADAQQKQLDSLEKKVTDFKEDITELEKKVEEIKVRQSTAEATREINKQLSDLDGVNETNDLVKRMEEKVSNIENESKAYEDLGENTKTSADRIEEVLEKASKENAGKSALEALKKKRETTNA